MNTRDAHFIMKSIACYGRANVGNFEPEMQSAIAELIVAGFVTPKIDEHQDTLWCYLTHTGYDKLFSLNSLEQPSWSLISWDQESATEAPVA